MRGRIYFIGSGPGDPTLMTIKGMEHLRAASLVLVPGFFKESYAEYLKGKDWFDPFDYYHADLVAKVDACLDSGRDAAFMIPGDLAIFTADHGCDPTTPSTDHSREYVPLLAGGPGLGGGALGTRSSFADLGATVAEAFGLVPEVGASFLREMGAA